MNRPVPVETFRPACGQARLVEGLPPAIDAAAERAPATHGFLRRAWFAAAVEAYGGRARTLMMEDADGSALALPMVDVGPRALGLAALPGSYWPFRSFPLAEGVAPGPALPALARAVRCLRIGPVPDGDPAAERLVEAARAAGWAALDRFVGGSWVFPIGEAHAAGEWPRASTLKKNRFHEKHLGGHGALDWRFLGGEDWPEAFDALAQVERRSWLSEREDADAKFTDTPHGRFWRAAARDERLRGAMRAALLRVDGAPAAFSFDLVAGDTAYAIANSYDPAYAKHSPGKLLYTRNLVDLLGRGVAHVDWGMGDSGYKRVIGAEPGPPLRDWLLVRPGAPATLARRLARWWARSAG